MAAWVAIERSSVRLYRPGYRTVKRLVDLTLCAAALPFVALAFLAITILIKLDSAGPALFVQERIGKGGRPFKMYKFRSMQHNITRDSHRAFMKAFIRGQISANGDHAVFKPFEAGQITRVGRFLRATSLDELPQVINVIKGEMSLVGPRPNVAWEVEEYKGRHMERLEVLPGITGLAQVRGRSGIKFDEIIRYDSKYVEKQCLLLDIKILWWTFTSVIRRTGAQ